jgi:AraC family transcriptional regulator of arabinose operon
MYWRPIWVHFQPRPFWLPWLEWPRALPGVLRLTLDDTELRHRIATRLEAVVSYAAVNHPMYEDLAMNALEEALLWCRRAYQMAVIVPRDQRIDRVVRYISEHPELPTTVTDMARISHLSPSRFAHRFRQVMGQTPLHFLEQMRMRRAVQLLRGTVQPVTEVAAASGFEDPLYFAKRFKKLTGTTPTEFRRSTKSSLTRDVPAKQKKK